MSAITARVLEIGVLTSADGEPFTGVVLECSEEDCRRLGAWLGQAVHVSMVEAGLMCPEPVACEHVSPCPMHAPSDEKRSSEATKGPR